MLKKMMLMLALLGAALPAIAADAVAPAAVHQALQGTGAKPVLLDVRTAEEFAEGHVPGAINIPVQVLGERLGELPKDADLVVYCKSGRRAEKAAGLLEAGGYARVRLMTGSMNAWNEAKLPVDR